MKRSIHPRAAEDLAEIIANYEKASSARLAARFLDDFERVANLLTENPGLGREFDLPRRIFGLRNFPYSIIYRLTDEGIRIVAVRHQSRHPKYAGDRS